VVVQEIFDKWILYNDAKRTQENLLARMSVDAKVDTK
jgi:hypothetical protein